MDTGKLKKFAQAARRSLIEQVSAKLDAVLAENSAARRESGGAVKDLESAIARDGRETVIDKVAYIWFNRFTALRYMDAIGLNQVRAVSPAEGQTRPELLADAMAGNYDAGATEAKVRALLEGRTPSNDPQGEAYRLLLVHACNSWHAHMPFMFEKIGDYTELLTPEDLLSTSSILADLREVMTEDACRDVEIIGWLYQFYISEKKDQVFAGLKKNVKITAENIPAATQLFTPHWIVRYLVENSLGRLWLLNRPDSRLAERMDYYIAPEEPETDFLRITRPEEIRICDPAAGSGHMLTYAFDLLHAIYEEEGYDPTEIPALILTHNLTGVEIDDRAGALAAFALMMKAAARLQRRRFLRMQAKPDICVLQDVSFTPAEMQDVAAVVGKDLFTEELRETLGQFEQAKNFGSLILPKLRDPAETLRVVEARDFGSDLLLKDVQARVIKVLRMAEGLSQKYHVVVANPPYMGGKGMNGPLGDFAKSFYPSSKYDLFSMFLERGRTLVTHKGLYAFLTIQNWMFLGSFERLRTGILSSDSITSLAQIGFNSFPELNSKYALAAASIVKRGVAGQTGTFFDLNSAPQSANKELVFKEKRSKKDYYSVTATEFTRIPGTPIAYWASENTRMAFKSGERLKELGDTRQGMATSDNNRFLRSWFEVGNATTKFNAISHEDAKRSGKKWFPYNKGGDFRKWFGNSEFLINWYDGGKEVIEYASSLYGSPTRTIKSMSEYFKPCISWSKISLVLSMRMFPEGYIFDVAGCCVFFKDTNKIQPTMAFTNSKVANHLLRTISPTVNFEAGHIASLPLQIVETNELRTGMMSLVDIARSDWDAYETSWDFTTLPLLSPDHRGETLAESYASLRAHWQSMTDEMQTLEEENNRIFIDAYGLQDELTPEVPLEEITLTCNPAYRYGVKSSEEDRETRLRADTMAEFLSYAVGCMFGRYSLDAPGLILANQGERLEDYLARIPEPTFMPDDDNIIPVLEADWFSDDIVGRFREFLALTFGEDKLLQNLAFIEEALGKDIRKYFTKDFYNDHVKRYKKRPIYWMFSSPKGSFNALIYMHRYRSDTVSVLLNDYLRNYITKLDGEYRRLETLSVSGDASASQKTKALRDLQIVARQIEELKEWESEVIYPLAQQKIEIDLDDGVKVNYPKFGSALKKITGLS